jgi:hypothetical protein
MDVNQPARSSIKRKRLHDKDAGDGEIACLLALPSDELGAILKFLPHKDRLELAVTAKSIHREVEAFCERIMKQIRVHHNVDATFEARIRERFDNALQQQGRTTVLESCPSVVDFGRLERRISIFWICLQIPIILRRWAMVILSLSSLHWVICF